MPELVIEERSDFLEAVLEGLAQPQKTVPARFLYDRRGSELFEEITGLPEYYPTRIERQLLIDHAADIRRLADACTAVVEFGSGSSAKTPLVLRAVEATTYVPIDISEDFLAASAARFRSTNPDVVVLPLSADFTRPLRLPVSLRDEVKLGFFPGSTIGNLSHQAAADLLRTLARTLGPHARLVIGIDTRKNPHLLEAAYDDSAGVTAAFNLNLLHRINRELAGNIPVEAFQHKAVWHDGLGRIEMHMAAVEDVSFRVAGTIFSMRSEETIHTENSYKYTPEEARLLARVSGWTPVASWMDMESFFSLHVWQVAPDRYEP